MPVISGKTVELKIVYYGPAMSGKTTNLQQVHAMIKAEHRGKLMSMSNIRDDRTVLLDLLPIQAPFGNSYATMSAKLFTVLSQVVYNNTPAKGAGGPSCAPLPGRSPERHPVRITRTK